MLIRNLYEQFNKCYHVKKIIEIIIYDIKSIIENKIYEKKNILTIISIIWYNLFVNVDKDLQP